jgi:hypothetical protein
LTNPFLRSSRELESVEDLPGLPYRYLPAS